MKTRQYLRESIFMAGIAASSFSDTYVNSLIDDAIENIAARIRLPKLEASHSYDNLDGSYSVDIPDNYHWGEFAVYVNGKPAWVCTSKAAFERRYPQRNNPVYGVEGHYIFVDGDSVEIRPAVTGTLVISYYKKPEPLAEEESTVTCIPADLQRKIIKAFALNSIFGDIEDAAEGTKVNTIYHEREYETQVAILEKRVAHKQKRPAPIRDRVAKAGI